MELETLIHAVQARPAIWDQKNINYHNRDIIVKLWGEIGKACNVSSDVAKSKWKHLRDNFRNEMKKIYRGKIYESSGGSPSSIPEPESRWLWFKSLQFLRDQMNSKVIEGHSQNGASVSQGILDENHSQIEPQIDIVEGDEEARFDDLADESCNSLMPSDEITHQSVLTKKRGKIARKRSSPDDNLDFQLDRKRPDHAGRFFEEDDTFHFLMSIRTPLRNLPIERQMFVRLKIQEIILNEISAQNRSRDAPNFQVSKNQNRQTGMKKSPSDCDENSFG